MDSMKISNISSAPILWPFNISLKSTLCIPKLALSLRFVGSAGQVLSFPVRLGCLTHHACQIDVCQNSEMLTEPLVAPYGTFCVFAPTRRLSESSSYTNRQWTLSQLFL